MRAHYRLPISGTGPVGPYDVRATAACSLRVSLSYSTMLYSMPTRNARPFHRGRETTRVTYRLGSELTEALRQLPNQTAFVERTLRDALSHVCPLCHGSGNAPGVHLAVSNLKNQPVSRLDRQTAVQLKALVRLGRQLLATQLDLDATGDHQGLGFRLAREDQLLLAGIIPPGETEVALGH